MRARSSTATRAVIGITALVATTLVGVTAVAQEPNACLSSNPNDWPDPARPYFMLLVDTSGSMLACTNPTTSWPNPCPAPENSNLWNSCGMVPSRLNDAKCALRQTVLAFGGEVNFGLATFGVELYSCNSGATTCNPDCNDPGDPTGSDDRGCRASGVSTSGEYYSASGCRVRGMPSNNNGSCGNRPDCNGGTDPPNPPNLPTRWRNAGRVVVPMLQDPVPWGGTPPASNVGEVLKWFDEDCSDSKELFALGATPTGEALDSLWQYFRSGWDADWSNTNWCDPLAPFSYTVPRGGGGTAADGTSPLTPQDPGCRAINVILVTDGNANCQGQAFAVGAASALFAGVTPPGGGPTFRIRTNVIAFAGANLGNAQAIAAAGGGVALRADNEAQLSVALSQIITGAIQPEICNNADDNCNGCSDEGYKKYCNRGKTPRTSPTQPGECCDWSNSTERDACLAAHAATVTPGNPTGDQWLLPCWDPATDPSSPETKWLCVDPGEVCDEADNNCDADCTGSPPGVSCGFQNLSSPPNTEDEGFNKCGSPLQCPVAETCDGVDEDCDGIIDNAPGSAVPFSLPGCTPCSPSQEICDGCDNDCDGLVDNGVPDVPCGFTQSTCVDNSICEGTRQCVPPNPNTVPVGGCLGPNGYGACTGQNPSPETCNNCDDDCSGVVDDGIPPTPCDAPGDPGTWVYGAPSQCRRGLQPCNGACSGWVGPSSEICDGIDNDCNGTVDDGVPGTGLPCGTDVGVCSKGLTACVGGVLVCQGGTGPGAEVCNGLDDDCDGSTDEAILNDAPATPGCWTVPGTACSHQNAQWSPPPGATCDGLGTLASPPCSVGTLVCQGAAGWACVGDTPPTSEVCNGVDDDCDGTPDEGNPGGGGTCGTDVGECSFGTQNCVGGTLVCQGGQGPTPEICNTLDDDCNGTADDNTAGEGQVCGSGLGECTTGLTACVGGALVCQGGQGPQPEVCNGLDDDCDGAVDDTPTDAPADPGCWQLPGSCCSHGSTQWCPPAGGTCTGAGTLTAPCAAGTLFCTGGAWTCQGGTAPGPEVCDGIDNDCNGTVDDGNPGGGGQCGTTDVGICELGTLTCVGGSLVCQGEVGPQPEVCNGLDDDCDGTPDDNVPGVGNQCGTDTGACSKGLTACVGGSLVCQGGQGPQPEVCNGVDDDCDGPVDEGVTDAPADPGCWSLAGSTCSYANAQWDPPPGATCTGVGSLTSPCTAGTLLCAGASGWACFGDTPPGPEVCDGVDNDCDGTPDDGNPGGGGQCGTDVGECEFGAFACVNGSVTCVGGVGPTQEVCNGLDDDCDGTPDDNPAGEGQVCGSNLGECSTGTTACVGGSFVCQGGQAPQPEVCNGLDDDCDGAIDDSVTDAPADPDCWTLPGSCCSFGALQWCPPAGAGCQDAGTLTAPCATGTLVCTGGGWVCQGDQGPGPEVCDGIDNDCDGTPDDGNPGGGAQCGTTDVGECEFGSITCVGGALVCQGEVTPAVEICDDLDNDCDGTVDNGVPGVGNACGLSTGQCQKGTTACVGGVLVCQGGVTPVPEVCNGLDDDCNGFTDDGSLADAPADPDCWQVPGSTCGFANLTWDPPQGAGCTDLGSLTAPCATGTLACDGANGWACQGGQTPTAEICDGIDDDCNGSVDDGNPGGGESCGSDVGECSPGTTVCVAGIIDCQGETGPQPEVCNGLDDDCDGAIDNGIPIGGSCQPPYDTAAYPGDRTQGECRPGQNECNGAGGLNCVGGVGPEPEVCDGKDNDCDGQVDEPGPPPDGVDGTADPLDSSRSIGQPCGVDEGECKQGHLACQSGLVVCLGAVGPQPEVCDCVDNDCNGVVDDDPEPGGSDPPVCNPGQTCIDTGDHCQCAIPCKTTEFPCPTGTECLRDAEQSGTGQVAGDFCVDKSPCGDCTQETVLDAQGRVICAPAGTVVPDGPPPPVCVCKGQFGCQSPCHGIDCPSGQKCVPTGPATGTCQPSNNCNFFGCATGKLCHNEACVDDPCEQSSCGMNEVCRPNETFDAPECVGSCADAACGAGERCESGDCVPTGCGQDCGAGEYCQPLADGGFGCGSSKCTADSCSNGAYCDPVTGACVDDPCEGVRCPPAQRCIDGECYWAPEGGVDAGGAGGAAGAGGVGGGAAGAAAQGGGAARPDAGVDASTGGGTTTTTTRKNDRKVWGLATGGGGCECRSQPGRRAPLGGLVLAAMAAGAFRRRRRRSGKGARA